MKLIYSLLFSLVFTSAGFSQSVISNVVPNFGDEFLYNQAEGAPSPGPAGADLTWDFSNETIVELTGNYSVMTPEQVAGSEDFPDATMVWVVDIGFGTLHSFISFDNNTFTDYGSISEGSGFSSGIQYSDPIDHFTYPLAYQSTGGDDYSGILSGLSGDGVITGSESYIVDGFGTVITPFGTYDDVLRITTTATESLEIFGSEVVTNSTETMWYSPDYPAPVMIILSDYSSIMGLPSDSTKSMSALVSYTPVVTGLDDRDTQNTFNVYPNPASDLITVTFDNVKANTVLNIYSSTGKLVETRSIQSDQKTDISALSPGIYIAVLRVDGQRYAQKPFSIVK